MNLVEPYCECPQCHMLGLHLMAEVTTQVTQEVKKWCEMVEVPSKYAWYDNRDEPAIELKPRYLMKVTNYYTESVVRECAFCSHKFSQEWKQWYEAEGDDW